MNGVVFQQNTEGKKTVTLDLEMWGGLWEDFYDILVSESRKDEERIRWDDLKEGAGVLD